MLSKIFLHICLCEVLIWFFSVMFHSASCDVIYIVTNANSPCLGEFTGVPCLTLQQYASNPIQSSNITLIVEPGTHYLSRELRVSNSYNFTMTSNNATVTCTSSIARFSFDSVEKVHISGMTFQMCSSTAIRMTNVTEAYIANSSFIGNVQQSKYRFGGAIYTSGSTSNIVIDQSSFSLNSAEFGGAICCVSPSTITINLSSFSDNRATESGGAIYWGSSLTISIHHSIFSGNSVVSSGARGCGGVIYVGSSSTITIDQSTFSGNSVVSSGARGCGGVIYASSSSTITIDQSTFSGNRAIRSSYGYEYFGCAGGGAIYAPYSSINIANMSLFDHNIANSSILSSSGGAIYGATVSVERSVFSHNTVMVHSSRGSGGAISGSTVTVETSVFSHNTANSSGGAIVCSNLQMSSTTVDNNRVTNGNGGAIDTQYRASFVSCHFVNNTASGFGGALSVAATYRLRSVLSVIDSSFINNRAIRDGGGAIYSNGRYASVTLSSSTFNYNSASYCSVLDVDEFYHFTVNLTNSVFTYNTATGHTIGGGVACIRNASINIVNSVFKHNFAYSHAGIFYIDESVTTVDGSIFINNSAALDGGVFYTYIHASDYIIRRSQFSDNAAGDDGGVMLIGRLNCFVSIDESIFDFNNATDRGGVIALFSSSVYMEINRTNIFNNTAQFGEVISACNSHVIFIEDIFTVTIDPLLLFCSLYGGDIHDFNITIPDLDLETAPPTTPEQPTLTEMLTTTELPPLTEAPAATSPPTRTATLIITTSESHTTIKSRAPDTTLTPTQPHTPQSNVTTTVTTPQATSVVNRSTSLSLTTDTMSQNSDPTISNEKATTSWSLDEDKNPYHTRGQSTTAEHTLGDENLVTVMIVVTDSRVIDTYKTIATASLVVSLVAITIILVFVFVQRFQRCLCKNEKNKSKAPFRLNDASKTDEVLTRDHTCSLPTYTSAVFDPHDDDFEKNVDA